MKSRTFLAVFLLLLVLALARAGRETSQNPPSHPFVFFQNQKGGTPPFQKEESKMDRLTLSFRGREILVEIADTDAERVRGLRGRQRLGASEGMLFIFPRAGYHGIWMKDTAFPIDILWLEDRKSQIDADTDTQINADGRISVHPRRNQRTSAVLMVVDIKENVLPETFPEVFYPKERARYVLEVPAGVAGKAGMKTGEILGNSPHTPPGGSSRSDRTSGERSDLFPPPRE